MNVQVALRSYVTDLENFYIHRWIWNERHLLEIRAVCLRNKFCLSDADGDVDWMQTWFPHISTFHVHLGKSIVSCPQISPGFCCWTLWCSQPMEASNVPVRPNRSSPKAWLWSRCNHFIDLHAIFGYLQPIDSIDLINLGINRSTNAWQNHPFCGEDHPHGTNFRQVEWSWSGVGMQQRFVSSSISGKAWNNENGKNSVIV